MYRTLVVLVMASLGGQLLASPSETEGQQPYVTEIGYSRADAWEPNRKNRPFGTIVDRDRGLILTIVDGLGVPHKVELQHLRGRRWFLQDPGLGRRNPLGGIAVVSVGSTCQAYVSWWDQNGIEHRDASRIKIDKSRPLHRFGERGPDPGFGRGEDNWVFYPCGGEPTVRGTPAVSYTQLASPEASKKYRGKWEPTLDFYRPGSGTPISLTGRQVRRDDFVHWYWTVEDLRTVPCYEASSSEIEIIDLVAGSGEPGKEQDFARIRDLSLDGELVTETRKGNAGSEYILAKLICGNQGETIKIVPQ